MMYQRARFQNECSEYDSRTGLPIVGRDLHAALDAYDVVDGSNLGYITLAQFRTLCRRINIRVDDFAFVSACVARTFHHDERREKMDKSITDDALLPPPATQSRCLPQTSNDNNLPTSTMLGQQRLHQLQRIHSIRARSRQFFAKENSQSNAIFSPAPPPSSPPPPLPPALILSSFSPRKSGSTLISRPTSAQNNKNNNNSNSRSLLSNNSNLQSGSISTGLLNRMLEERNSDNRLNGVKDELRPAVTTLTLPRRIVIFVLFPSASKATLLQLIALRDADKKARLELAAAEQSVADAMSSGKDLVANAATGGGNRGRETFDHPEIWARPVFDKIIHQVHLRNLKNQELEQQQQQQTHQVQRQQICCRPTTVSIADVAYVMPSLAEQTTFRNAFLMCSPEMKKRRHQDLLALRQKSLWDILAIAKIPQPIITTLQNAADPTPLHLTIRSLTFQWKSLQARIARIIDDSDALARLALVVLTFKRHGPLAVCKLPWDSRDLTSEIFPGMFDAELDARVDINGMPRPPIDINTLRLTADHFCACFDTKTFEAKFHQDERKNDLALEEERRAEELPISNMTKEKQQQEGKSRKRATLLGKNNNEKTKSKKSKTKKNAQDGDDEYSSDYDDEMEEDEELGKKENEDDDDDDDEQDVDLQEEFGWMGANVFNAETNKSRKSKSALALEAARMKSAAARKVKSLFAKQRREIEERKRLCDVQYLRVLEEIRDDEEKFATYLNKRKEVIQERRDEEKKRMKREKRREKKREAKMIIVQKSKMLLAEGKHHNADHPQFPETATFHDDDGDLWDDSSSNSSSGSSSSASKTTEDAATLTDDDGSDHSDDNNSIASSLISDSEYLSPEEDESLYQNVNSRHAKMLRRQRRMNGGAGRRTSSSSVSSPLSPSSPTGGRGRSRSVVDKMYKILDRKQSMRQRVFADDDDDADTAGNDEDQDNNNGGSIAAELSRLIDELDQLVFEEAVIAMDAHAAKIVMTKLKHKTEEEARRKQEKKEAQQAAVLALAEKKRLHQEKQDQVRKEAEQQQQLHEQRKRDSSVSEISFIPPVPPRAGASGHHNSGSLGIGRRKSVATVLTPEEEVQQQKSVHHQIQQQQQDSNNKDDGADDIFAANVSKNQESEIQEQEMMPLISSSQTNVFLAANTKTTFLDHQFDSSSSIVSQPQPQISSDRDNEFDGETSTANFSHENHHDDNNDEYGHENDFGSQQHDSHNHHFNKMTASGIFRYSRTKVELENEAADRERQRKQEVKATFKSLTVDWQSEQDRQNLIIQSCFGPNSAYASARKRASGKISSQQLAGFLNNADASTFYETPCRTSASMLSPLPTTNLFSSSATANQQQQQQQQQHPTSKLVPQSVVKKYSKLQKIAEEKRMDRLFAQAKKKNKELLLAIANQNKIIEEGKLTSQSAGDFSHEDFENDNDDDADASSSSFEGRRKISLLDEENEKEVKAAALAGMTTVTRPTENMTNNILADAFQRDNEAKKRAAMMERRLQSYRI